MSGAMSSKPKPRVIALWPFRFDFGTAHYGIWIGCLTVVLFSPWARSLRWDCFRAEWIGGCLRVKVWFVVANWWRPT